MKNIHIIPTDKPSRLLKTIPKGNLLLAKESIVGSHWGNLNIYITSEEVIKEGDWVYCIREGFEPVLKQKVNTIGVNNDEMMKKIILTTDQDLIKDNVQAIDDEFLEWFVKNPSCEEVEVMTDAFTVKEMSMLPIGTRNLKYKIIIPKKEPKQNLPYWFETQEWKDFSKLAHNNFGGKPKQETLEEAAENYGNSIGNKNGTAQFDFIRGAKWQAERMYSQEEVLELIKNREDYMDSEDNILDYQTIKDWFEQFKKK